MVKKYIERYWRKATKEDSIKEPPMVARFRDSSSEEWKIRKLLRWDRGEDPWISDFGHSYPECEVYDAPDPGEGYELIDPMAECPGPGFEFLYGQHWHPAGEKVLEWDTFYRRKIQPEAKPEAAEPVTFVAHPIQINEQLEYCFKGKPIQFRSYAVINEQGHYLQHLPAYPPQYAPEFRQAFTPLQLLQLSVRELGSNIRLRAVEPVDVDKLKQEYMLELKEKLQPKAPQPAKSLRQAYEDASRLKVILSLLDSFQPITHAGAEKKSWIRSAAMFLIGETERCIHDNSLDLGKRVED